MLAINVEIELFIVKEMKTTKVMYLSEILPPTSLLIKSLIHNNSIPKPKSKGSKKISPKPLYSINILYYSIKSFLETLEQNLDIQFSSKTSLLYFQSVFDIKIQLDFGKSASEEDIDEIINEVKNLEDVVFERKKELKVDWSEIVEIEKEIGGQKVKEERNLVEATIEKVRNYNLEWDSNFFDIKFKHKMI